MHRGGVLTEFVGGCCCSDFVWLLGSQIATSLLPVVLVAAGSAMIGCGCYCRAVFDWLGDGCLRDV